MGKNTKDYLVKLTKLSVYTIVGAIVLAIMAAWFAKNVIVATCFSIIVWTLPLIAAKWIQNIITINNLGNNLGSFHNIPMLAVRALIPSNTPIFALYISGLLTISGLALSSLTADWTWFSRFGAIIVIIGMLLVYEDFEKLAQEEEPFIASCYKDLTTLNLHQISEMEKEQLLEKGNMQMATEQEKKDYIEGLNNDISEHINSGGEEYTKNSIKNLPRNIEKIILITGTLIWGFGDSIACIFVTCNQTLALFQFNLITNP